MPELCRFAGMIIKMLYKDNVQHNKPHVHVFYGEYEASVGVDGELYAAWNKAVCGEPFEKIKPLA